MDYRVDSTAGAGGEVYKPAFEQANYPHISYGLPLTIACKKHVSATFQASRVFIIASASLAKNTDHAKNLQAALGEKLVGTRVGMRPHTYWSEILEVVKSVKEAGGVDLIITIGAGSLTDGAKVIALALANNATNFEDLSNLHSGDDWTRQRPDLKKPDIPIISIPTSLSGGEYSFLGGATNDQDGIKYGFGHPTVGPALVVLDPDLTTSTPEHVWLQSGVRAVDHCVEGMCSLQSTEESNRDAAKGLRDLIPGLLRCKADAKDLEARLNCQMGVIESMKVVFQHGIPMGASHGIGHQLGPLGVGHGETSCILLPAVCKYNLSVNAEQQRRVCDLVWEEDEAVNLFEEKGLSRGEADLGDLLHVFIQELGMPRSLKEVGVEGKEKLRILAKNAMHDRWCKTNPRPLNEEGDVLEILEKVK